jgi:phosphoribosylanthranilate isomerase
MVKVKICGITDPHDASVAVELGADSLGFIFAPSPRQVTPEEVRTIVITLPPFVKTVGVFIDEDLATIKQIIDFCGLDLVQLHGDESPEMCHELLPRSIKAFRVRDESSVSAIGTYQGSIKAVLFDSHSEEKRGGTGKTFDWNLAMKGKEMGMPVILSGGLTPSNIQEAILSVKSYAVDVNSGVETSPGRKSLILMKKLMETIRQIDVGGLPDD